MLTAAEVYERHRPKNSTPADELIAKGFFDPVPRYYWLTRKGMVYGVADMQHTRLLQEMGLYEGDCDHAGWVRMSYDAHCITETISVPQRNYLRKRNSLNSLIGFNMGKRYDRMAYVVQRRELITKFDISPARTLALAVDVDVPQSTAKHFQTS
jgi:hypothetical protein